VDPASMLPYRRLAVKQMCAISGLILCHLTMQISPGAARAEMSNEEHEKGGSFDQIGDRSHTWEESDLLNAENRSDFFSSRIIDILMFLPSALMNRSLLN
jgi:hypothetical protein